MTQIDKSKPVLVTGATGYVAGVLCKRLLEDGLVIHAAVRDPDNADKLKYLNELVEDRPGTIRYFKSDLLNEGSYAEAMSGCELVYHTASPFTVSVRDPQKELIEPAELGTQNVLHTACETDSVKRVVVTSSVAAIYGDNIDLKDSKTGQFTEEDWNTTSTLDHNPYSLSKTRAEKEAWRIAESQDKWDLVTVNPSLVIGAGINPHATSESFNLIKNFGDGTMRLGVPDFGMGLVDVRDVAECHYRAGFTPQAHGRYLTSGHNSSFPEIAAILKAEFGSKYAFPLMQSPKPMVWLFGPIIDKTITRKMISRNVGYPVVANHSKSVNELGMSYRPLKDSLVEFFQQLIDAGAFRK